MSKTNSQIFREMNETVINAKRFDLIHDYYDEGSIFHNPPYVGFGFSFEDSGELILKTVADPGPSAGLLLPGDKLVRVSDANRVWQTYREIRDGFFGMGQAGTSATFTVERDGEQIDVPVMRGRLDGYDLKLSDVLTNWENYLTKDWPELKVDIHLVIEQDDLVAYYLTYAGTNREYRQSAVWAEGGMVRFREEKIVETWAAEDLISQYLQIGYTVQEPVQEPA